MIPQIRQIFRTRRHTDGQADIVHLLGAHEFGLVHFPGVQDFSAQGQDSLELPVTRLLRRAAGRITLNQEKLAALGIR